MTTACQVVDTARRELGQVEDPPQSNHTKYGEWFGLDRQPWCAIFVTWVFAQAKMDLRALLGQGIEYTPTFAALGRKAGWEVQRPAVQAGDILLFKFLGHGRIHHAGICAEDGIKPGLTVVTIEGNTSSTIAGSQDNGGCVARRLRPLDSIACVLRPPFEPCAAPAPAPLPPAELSELERIARDLTAAKQTTLRVGSSGSAVKWLQIALNRGGKILSEDSNFGRQTRAAVLAFQRAHGLVADGIVGPATWSALWPS